jgi:hypothetical protein
VFVGLALLYGEVTELHGRYALVLLIITFTALMLVAIREVRRKKKARVAAHAGASVNVLRQEPGDPFRPAESRAEV